MNQAESHVQQLAADRARLLVGGAPTLIEVAARRGEADVAVCPKA